MLTFWQGGFGNIKFIRSGIPRDLEPWAKSSDGDGGLSRKIRNLRFAVSIIAIVPSLLVALIYYANPRPKLQRLGYFVCAFILIFSFVLGIIAFCLDVTRQQDAKECHTDVVTKVKTCEKRAAYATACTALDLITAAFAIVSALMLVMFSKDDTFKHTQVAWSEQNFTEDPNFVEEVELKPVIPGQDVVHKSLVFIGLLATLVASILLMIFTIMIHEFREKVVGKEWDPINGQNQSGWERENTRLRLSIAIITILLCFLSFVPYPHRVYAYSLAWLFVAVGAMHFVIFAIDVNDLRKAKNLTCPEGVYCIFHKYNTTCVFDFLNGVMVLVYVLYEFIIKGKSSTVTVHRDLPAAPLEEFTAPSPYPVRDFSTVIKPDGTPAITGPSIRPLLGVEVIEVEHPATRELSVTVINVTPGGAAEEAGLRVGDIISKWDEIPITCKADFAQAVNAAPIGSQVILQLIRQSQGVATTTSIQYARLTVRGVPV